MSSSKSYFVGLGQVSGRLGNMIEEKLQGNMIEEKLQKSILGACIGDCIHVAGILNFMNIAEQYGFNTNFLGPATSIDKIIEEIKKNNPGYVVISYRLTPQVGFKILKEFIEKIKQNKLTNRKFFLGCLPDLKKMIEPLGFFDNIFIGGESINEILPILQSSNLEVNDSSQNQRYPSNLLDRIKYKAPYPVIRAHFGLPSLEETIEGVKKIAEANVLDVISIAPDQAAQEWFFRPEILKTRPKGSGGVPIRSPEHLKTIYKSSRTGNYPLLRIYSGTQDLIKNADMFQKTIKNAWAAIPIFWYSELDGRGPLKLEDAIKEHFEAIKWHAERNIPVEINDPHQWGLRMAPDYLVVADAYICTKIAKELGVKNYIEQIMFNTPAGNSLKMDLARALAMKEIVEPLKSNNFNVIIQTRAGLAYFSPIEEIAKSQLITSTILQMALKPQIMHVVSYCEATHAAKADDIIKSCRIVQKAVEEAIKGLPDLTLDPEIIARKNQLIEKARQFISVYEQFAKSINKNPYKSPIALSEAVRIGLFDAPQLKNNPAAKGEIKIKIINGKCEQINMPKEFSLKHFIRNSKIKVIN
ncbi:MAG: cobalamin B12-binding domain-containing protein [Promethearchaeota archaeon]